MAQTTVSDLAKVVGVSAEKLLSQVKEAGLPHTAPGDRVSNEDKNTLLEFLRRSHGGRDISGTAPRKITLKRKTMATLKTASTHGRGKTVNVEVRKKRTFVKRSSLPKPEDAEQSAADAQDGAAADFPVNKLPPQNTGQDAQEAKDTKDKKDPRDKGTGDARDSDSRDKKDAKPGDKRRRDAKPGERDAAAKRGKRGGKGKAGKKTPRGADGKAAKRGTRQMFDEDFVLEGDDSESESGRRPRRGRKLKARSPLRKHAFEKPTGFIARQILISENNAVTDIAAQMSVKSREVVKALTRLGVIAGMEQKLDQDTATLLIEEMGHKARFISEDAVEKRLDEYLAAADAPRSPRAPVVTVMGHVDHGKTSLLDRIRKSAVAEGEAGGITQHIGAYHVDTGSGGITFLDTPGHAAFTAMRSRGAKATDVIVLVVAADDGVMPQTEEAVQHARAAGVPIVVAVNKIDKESADPEQVKNDLAALQVIPEDWGGDTQFVPVSAHTGDGMDKLLEAVLLQAEMLELKARRDGPGRGIVIESRLDRNRGTVASVLVQDGTLRAGDVVLVGHDYGKVRALMDEQGRDLKSAGPSLPVEVLGLNGVPEAGEPFVVAADEKQAREVAAFRQRQGVAAQPTAAAAQAENLFADLGREKAKTCNVVIKADVRGSLEAIAAALQNLATDEVKLSVVSAGVGGISETDVHLAATTGAVIIGFNVRADKSVRDIVERERLQLRYYNVIYNVIDDIKAVMSGMLSPEIREEIVGVAEVRDVFSSPKFGQIAGSMVVEGTVYRSKPIRVLRDNVVIYEGELESLRRFKDDATEVRNGMECGIGVRNYNDVRIGDKIEVYETTEVARSL